MSYGPQLPSWLTKTTDEEKKEHEEEDDSPNVYGPVIPGQTKPANSQHDESGKSDKEVGPKLPPNLSKSRDDSDDDEEVDTSAYGPSIPKPAVSKSPDAAEDDDDSDYAENSYGPSIPANFRPQVSFPVGDESDDEIGPMPVSKGNEEREALERAYRLAMQKETEDEEKNAQPKREEWMTAVPKKLGVIGLGARTFKKGTTSERDDTWEDAPGAKKKRKEDAKSSRSAGMAASDARQAAIVDAKASGPSLLELHQKKREEKVKDGYTPGERRPFDRDKDMDVRGLKPGRSNEVVDQMKEFSSKFASSKDQRFL